MNNHIDRIFVRSLLKHTQMEYPTDDQIAMLYGCMVRRLIEFDGIQGTYRVDRIENRSITVKSYYFEGRQGVTFDPDFVGICGWADENNQQPILWSLVDWVKEVTGFDATPNALKNLPFLPEDKLP